MNAAEELAQAAAATGALPALAAVQYLIGRACLNVGDFGMAQKALTAALSVATASQEHLLAARASSVLVSSLMKEGDVAGALGVVRQAMASTVYAETDREHEANMLLAYVSAEILRSVHDDTSALERIEEALYSAAAFAPHELPDRIEGAFVLGWCGGTRTHARVHRCKH
jgi:hypothetical protein